MDVRERHREGCVQIERNCRDRPRRVLFFLFFLLFLAHFFVGCCVTSTTADATRRFAAFVPETRSSRLGVPATEAFKEQERERQRERERAREERLVVVNRATDGPTFVGRPTAQKRRRQQDKRAQTNVAIVQLTTASGRANVRERNRPAVPGARRLGDLRPRSWNWRNDASARRARRSANIGVIGRSGSSDEAARGSLESRFPSLRRFDLYTSSGISSDTA